MDPIAAGGLPWRYEGRERRFAVVHRPRYDDWSLPKGKLAKGELPVLAAVREVTEETGLAVRLGPRLPTTTYQADGTDKSVHWWAMPTTGMFADGADGFVPNDEVDELAWWSLAEAEARLSYPDDVELVRTLQRGPAVPSRVVLVRHGSAGDREAWAGRDGDRPLDDRGRSEAAALAECLRWFGPTRVLSAAPVRCRETVAPLADRLGVPVEDAAEFGEDAYWLDPAAARSWLHELLAEPAAVPVICSQGGAIPDLIARILATGPAVTGVSPRRTDPDPPARKGSAWVLHADAVGRVRVADYYGSFLPG